MCKSLRMGRSERSGLWGPEPHLKYAHVFFHQRASLHVQASQGASCVLLPNLHRAFGAPTHARTHAATFTEPERTLDRAAPVCARLPVGFSVLRVAGQRVCQLQS